MAIGSHSTSATGLVFAEAREDSCADAGKHALAMARSSELGRPVYLTSEQRFAFFQNGATSGFEMCFTPSTKGAGGPTNQITSRIQCEGVQRPI